MTQTVEICANLIANPATGDTELSLELEVTESGEKPIEDALLDGSEFDCVANVVLRRHWCACRSAKRRCFGEEKGFGGTVRVKRKKMNGRCL